MKRISIVLLLVLVSTVSRAQLKPGQQAPEIALPGKTDSIIKLSSLRGKVVLIDFWASWCGPCRASNPSIQKLYKKFQSNGFEVYAVSLDVSRKLWQKAVRHDKLTYTQVIDQDGWLSKVAEQYFVDAIPTNFLLDQIGRIVAINLEGKELADKVQSLLQ